MTTGVLSTFAVSDAGDLLGVLTTAAGTIDYSASVAAATASNGAIDIADVAGLSLLAQIAAVNASLATLVATPTTLATSLIGIVQGFAGTSVDFRDLADSLTGVTWSQHWRWNDVDALAIGTNRDALQTMMVVQCVIEAVRAASTATFDSQDAAFALGDDLAARIDGVVSDLSSRPMRSAMRSLKTALVTDINTRAAQLTALESWIVVGDVPALVLASRIYDDPTMATDIVARNAIENPLFVTAQTLTILTPGAAS